MRRFKFSDPEFNIHITMDVPEEVFNQFKSLNVLETIKKARELAIYTINSYDHMPLQEDNG